MLRQCGSRFGRYGRDWRGQASYAHKIFMDAYLHTGTLILRCFYTVDEQISKLSDKHFGIVQLSKKSLDLTAQMAEWYGASVS